MSVLSARSIRELVRGSDLVRLPGGSGRETISALYVQPCSIDVTLDSLGLAGGHVVAASGWAGEYRMQSGEFLLGCTREVFRMPADVMGLVVGKSSVARLGMMVECAGLIDPGFEGQIVLEMKNLLLGPSLPLTAGMRIAQVNFMWLDSEVGPDDMYGSKRMDSHYQGQRGITRSHLRML